jgi:hypothetical protein
MSERRLGHYQLVVRAGPAHTDVQADVEYFDQDREYVGHYGETMIAFATTWKDVAWLIRHGEQLLRLDRDPVPNPSPMVDLS